MRSTLRIPCTCPFQFLPGFLIFYSRGRSWGRGVGEGRRGRVESGMGADEKAVPLIVINSILIVYEVILG